MAVAFARLYEMVSSYMKIDMRQLTNSRCVWHMDHISES